MHREPLLSQIDRYVQLQPESSAVVNKIIDFIRKYPECFRRELEIGHVTGSCLLLNPKLDKILLTHHKKLGLWLQLGGHADGENDILAVALKEAEEESGIAGVSSYVDGIIDIDIHEIPELKHTPAHIHYDIRYLFVAPHENFVVSDESMALKWFSFDEVQSLNTDESLKRLVQKTRKILQN